ncbi:hypothetical protein ACWKSP_28245 [Micromonosporaceae bacterium Da 78-11]
MAVTVPSVPAAPCTVIDWPAFTSFRAPLVAADTAVLSSVLTVTTVPSDVCT